jgi:hypothetical protein
MAVRRRLVCVCRWSGQANPVNGRMRFLFVQVLFLLFGVCCYYYFIYVLTEMPERARALSHAMLMTIRHTENT